MTEKSIKFEILRKLLKPLMQKKAILFIFRSIKSTYSQHFHWIYLYFFLSVFLYMLQLLNQIDNRPYNLSWFERHPETASFRLFDFLAQAGLLSSCLVMIFLLNKIYWSHTLSSFLAYLGCLTTDSSKSKLDEKSQPGL